MKQILTIEELQDELMLKKEIYEVEHYVTDKQTINFFSSFRLMNDKLNECIKDGKTEYVSELIAKKNLFSTKPIKLLIKDNKVGVSSRGF